MLKFAKCNADRSDVCFFHFANKNLVYLIVLIFLNTIVLEKKVRITIHVNIIKFSSKSGMVGSISSIAASMSLFNF